MSDTVVIAVVGVLGTLAGAVIGPWTQTWLASHREQALRLRESRTEIFDDAMRYAQSAQMLRDTAISVDSRDVSKHRLASLAEAGPAPELTTARMWLLAPIKVARAWEDLCLQCDSLAFRIREDGLEADPLWVLPEDHAQVVALTAALDHFRDVVRDAMQVPD